MFSRSNVNVEVDHRPVGKVTMKTQVILIEKTAQTHREPAKPRPLAGQKGP